MADEEKEGLQTEENTGEADSQTPETPEKEVEEKVDWEKRYKDLQTDHTQTKQRLAAVEREYSQTQQPPEEPEEDFSEPFVDPKTVSKMIDKAVSKAMREVRMQTADSYFRRTYPDIVKHENIISGILRNPKNPESLKGASAEDRIDSAVKEFNALTEDAVTEATKKAEEEAKEREEKNKKATGLGGPSTTPAKGDEGESDEEEIKRRKARQAKQRGIA